MIRWKLALQEYNFLVEHVQGKSNLAADALSRLVETSSTPMHATTSGDATIVMLGAIGFQERQIPDDKYDIIVKCHNTTVGHHGVEQTLTRIRK